MSLFDEGVRILEERTASTCFGVFPYAADLHLDAEDSLALRDAARKRRRRQVRGSPSSTFRSYRTRPISGCSTGRTGSRRLPRSRYDFVVLPGSKNTIADLAWLRETGLADWILEQHRGGATVVGICGGYQMLGRTIHDPDGMESRSGSAEGLGLLPASTSLSREKRTQAVRATTPGGVRFGGYEIHLGVTTLDRDDRLRARLRGSTMAASRASVARASSARTCTAHSSTRACAPKCSGSRRLRRFRRPLTMRGWQPGSSSTSGITSGSSS